LPESLLDWLLLLLGRVFCRRLPFPALFRYFQYVLRGLFLLHFCTYIFARRNRKSNSSVKSDYF
jgi:hypothetical protein